MDTSFQPPDRDFVPPANSGTQFRRRGLRPTSKGPSEGQAARGGRSSEPREAPKPPQTGPEMRICQKSENGASNNFRIAIEHPDVVGKRLGRFGGDSGHVGKIGRPTQLGSQTARNPPNVEFPVRLNNFLGYRNTQSNFLDWS